MLEEIKVRRVNSILRFLVQKIIQKVAGLRAEFMKVFLEESLQDMLENGANSGTSQERDFAFDSSVDRGKQSGGSLKLGREIEMKRHQGVGSFLFIK